MPLLVLEGLDGAGKSTQIALLQEELARRGIACEYLHFPRFDAPVYGDLIARFLRGEFGQLDQVHPDLVALIFAGDRADAAPKMREWLAEGKFVLLDRYVYSNVAFQGAKLEGAERELLARWIVDMEFGYNKLPRPDASFFLDVPFEFVSRKLTAQRTGDDRAYLRGAADIHEGSLDLQRRVREVYLACASHEGGVTVIECSDTDGGMLPSQGIFEKIVQKINHLL